MPRLTDNFLRVFPPPPPGRKKILIPDRKEKGKISSGDVARFQACITEDGARSFVIRYTVNARERLMTIGRFPEWTTEAAREEAKRLLQLVDQGVDPLQQRNAAREAPRVKELAERFIEEHATTKRPSYLVTNNGMLRNWILPELGNIKVADVNPGHVQALHRKVTKAGSPVMANRVIACLSKMMSLAVRWQYRGDNPCKGAVDRNNEIQRQVYLKPDEILRVAAEMTDCISDNCIRLTMLTGCRRGEAMAARWDQFDPEFRRWSKPPSSTKQNKPHEVPLSAPARELLVRLKAYANGPYVFPRRDGTGHITDVKTRWEAIRKAAGISGVRLHDLRHSFASIAVSRGATLPLIGALLGHSNAQTTMRYAHLFDDPQRAVAESVGAIITGSDEAAEVLPIGRKR